MKTKKIALLAAVVVLVGVLLMNKPAAEQYTLGYVVYDPLMLENVNDELSGISYDIAEAVAKKLDLKLVWSVESTWPTAIDEMNAGDFDFVGTQMWPDSGRREKALFSTSPLGSPVYVYARANDARFDFGMASLNLPDLQVATVDTEIVGAIITADYPNLTMYSAARVTYEDMFNAVADGSADLIFAEPAEAEAYMAANPGRLRQVSETPVRVFDNSFAFKRSDSELMARWDQALAELKTSGEIDRILDRYDAAAHFIIPD